MADINPPKLLNRKKGYDMRERVGEIPNDKYVEIGLTLGKRMMKEALRRCVLGGDARVTTPAFKEEVMRGLRQHHLEVIDLGINLPTPLLYVGYELYGADVVAAVTASHSSWDWNGVKINFREENDPKKDYDDFLKSYNGDVKSFYQAFLQRKFGKEVSLKIAVDSLWGSYSDYAPEVLRAIGYKVTSDTYLHNGIKSFPNDLESYSSDPHKKKNLEHLVNCLKNGEYDLGIAFDGDGDRVKFVDETGDIVSEDEITAIIGKYLLQEYWDNNPDAQTSPKIITEIKSSKLVEDVITRSGGELIREQTGRVNIKKTMSNNSDIIFGGELSGHYFYRKEFCGKEFYFVDTGEDGLFTALLLGQIQEREGKTLSEMRGKLPKYNTSEEIRYNYKSKENAETVRPEIEGILNFLNDSYQSDSAGKDIFLKIGDDVRVEKRNNGYSSVVFRSSNNDPQKITLVFEGKTAEELNQIKGDFVQRLRNSGLDYSGFNDEINKLEQKIYEK